jgi:hypothetical protein
LINDWDIIQISCRCTCTWLLSFLVREFWLPNVINLTHHIWEGHAWSIFRQERASVVASDQNMQPETLCRTYLLGDAQFRSQFFEISANSRIISECSCLMGKYINKIKKDDSQPYITALS